MGQYKELSENDIKFYYNVKFNPANMRESVQQSILHSDKKTGILICL